MKSFEPREMPLNVKADYRDPIELGRLLQSSVFSSVDKEEIRDRLLELFESRHGTVWVPYIGGDQQASKVARSIDPAKAIWFLLKIDDYGDRDEKLRSLAQAMNPSWLRWWESQQWDSYNTLSLCVQNWIYVLGNKQLAWIATETARSTLPTIGDKYRKTAALVLDEVQRWLQPLPRKKISDMIDLIDTEHDRAINAGEETSVCGLGAVRNAAFLCMYIATNKADQNAASVGYLREIISNASWSYAYDREDKGRTNGDAEFDESITKRGAWICDLAQRLITPSLV